MEHLQNIGHAVTNHWPYDIEVSWKNPAEPLLLSEGVGHGSAGGYFALAAIKADIWTEHLTLCHCLWLRDLADEETRRNRLYTADEIVAAWRERTA